MDDDTKTRQSNTQASMPQAGRPHAPSTSPSCGVLLCAHGSRHQDAVTQSLRLKEKVARALGSDILTHLGFLEFNDPPLHDALAHLHQQGAQRIAVLPLMLLCGNHVRHDIPAIGAAFERRHAVPLTYGKDLGDHPSMLKLAGLRLSNALGNALAQKPQTNDAVLLIIGRGNEDEKVNDQLRRIARKIAATANLPHHLCFAGLTAPDIPQGLRDAQKMASHIIILPYLLFTGLLTQRLERHLKDITTPFTLCETLGPHDVLASLLAERARALLFSASNAHSGR